MGQNLTNHIFSGWFNKIFAASKLQSDRPDRQEKLNPGQPGGFNVPSCTAG
jgi:hypothetical protein